MSRKLLGGQNTVAETLQGLPGIRFLPRERDAKRVYDGREVEMLELVQARKGEIGDLCRQFHVRRLEVFGSAARGDFDPDQSDVDFLVEFGSDPSALSLKNYFALKEALEALLGRPVDLVMPGAVKNPYLKASIERSRTPVYGE